MSAEVPLDRLVGLEQEYAVALRGEVRARPGNRALYLRLRDAVARRVPTRSAGGVWGWARERVFTSTGGSLYYESLPQAADAGLVEAATPECRGPEEALRYARAWDRLLEHAARDVTRDLGATVVVRKNGRDAFGNVYGPQENYDVDLATGPWLALHRAALLVLVPWAVMAGALHLAVLATMLSAGVFVATGAMAVAAMAARLQQLWEGETTIDAAAWADATITRLASVERWSLVLWFGPLVATYSAVLHLVAWRPYRQGAMAFLVTRSIVSGAGSVRPDGRLDLSEKADAIRRVMRWTFASDDRGLLETGHLMKGLLGPMLLRPGHLAALWSQRQRLQLGMSDANLCEVAEYLKLATTSLVLDLCEAGVLTDAPRPVDPVEAARVVSLGGVHAVVLCTDGLRRTALDLQRHYHEAALVWLSDHPSPSLEAHRAVARWGQVLDALGDDPAALVGQLDWVTKQSLVAEAGPDLTWTERKAIDLRYHELGDGYHAWMDSAGLVERLTDDAAVDAAMSEPPADTPAAVRGRLVRDAAPDEELLMDWHQARVGGQVIRFEDARRARRGDADD